MIFFFWNTLNSIALKLFCLFPLVCMIQSKYLMVYEIAILFVLYGFLLAWVCQYISLTLVLLTWLIDCWCFNTIFKHHFLAISWRPVFISGGGWRTRRKHPPLIGKLSILVNKDWSRVHGHKLGRNSQLQCWLASDYSTWDFHSVNPRLPWIRLYGYLLIWDSHSDTCTSTEW